MDHIQGAGVTARKLKCPVYIAEKCFEKKAYLFDKTPVNYIIGGDVVKVGNFSIKAFSTRHDSEECLGFVITEKDTNKKLAFLTDTGSITKLMREVMRDCDAYMIEADYDEEGLEKNAEYDDILKQRIRSDFGHLSNTQALEYISNNVDLNKTQWILFSHMSENTNSPEILEKQAQFKLPEIHWGKIHIAKNITKLNIG